nr:endopeptidase La [Clostridiales bacterium]
VTMATSLLSALTGRKVNGHVAMTGEISLTGNVMPIGGLREKTMAAYKAGIKTVVIPKENMPDLDDVVDVVKKNIEFVPAAKLDDVFKVALL